MTAGRRLHQLGARSGKKSSDNLLSKSLCANILILAMTLAVSANTWAHLRYIVQQQESVQAPAYGLLPVASLEPISPYGLLVMEKPAIARPSIQVSKDEGSSINRKFYGGKGDKAHLGGFTSFDPMGVSPTLWAYMVSKLGIKSILDVGCGRGISTSWFVLHGLEYVVCVEGSHDAVTQSLLNKIGDTPGGTKFELVEHDFSRGPWWPRKTVDAVWCVEFTEHVGRNYQPNYITAWRKAAIIFFTHSLWGGWHHVEVHDSSWWIDRMTSMGFVYSDSLTEKARDLARKDRNRADLVNEMKHQNRTKSYNVGQHIFGTLLVFINPLVSSRYEHAHLFAEHGCNSPKYGREQECGKPGLGDGVSELTGLPEHFKSIPLSKEMDSRWFDLIEDIPLPM